MGADPGPQRRSGQAAFAERLPGPEPSSGSRVTAGDGVLPRILYIAGIPRSGSTVLGIVLGSIPDAIYVGELENFWRRFADNELCSCGVPLPDCPFWSAVVGKAFGEVTRERAHKLWALEKAVWYREWPLILAPLQWPATKSRRIGVMVTERARLYQAIGEVANATWVVDSGKEPIYGGIVARMEGVDFSTIHTVRDPRGVAFSWRKRDPRGARRIWSDKERRTLRRHSALTSTLRWVRQNLIIQFLLRRLGNAYIRVRYEDLAQRPADVQKAVADATSAPVGHERPATATALVEGQYHWVATNKGVRKRLGEGMRLTLDELTLDEQWRAGMPRTQRWLVTGACGLLMAAYGYPLSSSRPRTGPR